MPSTFAVDPKGPGETAVVARAKKGTTIRFSLSESARAVFTIESAMSGRLLGRRCKPPSASNRRKRGCTRYAFAARFAQQAVGGTNSKRWSGKIGRKGLPPGIYRLTIVATDAAGNRSRPASVRFKIVSR
jgi:hypothetical protein